MDEFVCGKVLRVRDHTGKELPKLVCTLPEFHRGSHRNESGAIWMNTEEELEALRVPVSA